MFAGNRNWEDEVIRPTTWEVAEEFWKWDGDKPLESERIKCSGITAIVHGKDTPDGSARIDITPRLAMENRRAFGYLCEIFESTMTENTDTPYRMTAIIQVAYFDQNDDFPSWFWAKTNLFSSNLVATEPQTAILGTPVMGIVAATYGSHLTTQMEAWKFSNPNEWKNLAPAPLPHPRCIDLDPVTIKNIPMLGGCGYDLESTRWCLAGVRLKPTQEEIHTHQREQRAARERNGDRYGPSISGSPPEGETPVNQRDVRATARRIYEGQRHGQYEDPTILSRSRNRRAQLDAMRRNR